jgi:hypothetical protein
MQWPIKEEQTMQWPIEKQNKQTNNGGQNTTQLIDLKCIDDKSTEGMTT